MGLTFPRKFAHGQKVGNADVYGGLFLWSVGHFQYMVHIRNSDPRNGGRINVSFALLDEQHVPLGALIPAFRRRFGLPKLSNEVMGATPCAHSHPAMPVGLCARSL